MPVWGRPASHLLRRALTRSGVADAAAWPAPAPGPVLLARADHVYDAPAVAGLVAAPGTLLLRSGDDLPVAAHVPPERAAAVAAALDAGRGADDPAFAGLRRAGPGGLTGGYNKALRKRDTSYVLPLTAESRRAVEWRMFGGSYKGVTDAITKYVWPRPAFHVTRWCAALGITPNQVTAASLVLVLLALWLFWRGQFVPGLLAAWVMTFLDTVDGKLARVTLTSTPFGTVFDHMIDLIHPPFWWLAWIVGLDAAGLPLAHPWLVGAVVAGGYVVQRLEEGAFIQLYGMHLHVWERFDSLFRLVLARRNPNLVLLTLSVLVGRPDWGMVAVAVWTAACCVEQAVRIGQAFAAGGRGAVRSWLEG